MSANMKRREFITLIGDRGPPERKPQHAGDLGPRVYSMACRVLYAMLS
jgi:hypothetical protein